MLLNNLNDLCSYLDSLSSEAKNNDLVSTSSKKQKISMITIPEAYEHPCLQTNEENLTKALDAANKLADLSTQMHLSLDPNTKRRSKILMVQFYIFCDTIHFKKQSIFQAKIRLYNAYLHRDYYYNYVQFECRILQSYPASLLEYNVNLLP